MKAFVAVTDFDWFTFLSALPEIDEVNFWQPGGSHRFQSLSPGEPFLFKLHSPRDYIVGGRFFAHNSILPLRDAAVWNGCARCLSGQGLSGSATQADIYIERIFVLILELAWDSRLFKRKAILPDIPFKYYE